MNTELARRNMITQQFRTCDILDDALLTLLQSTPRENFVPAQYEGLAFSDTEIPLPHGESMLSPLLEAKILSNLQIKPDENVLEVGTGSGYLTCLLGKACHKITSIDIYSDFLNEAASKLSNHGVHNVELIEANGIEGYGKNGPYDAIVYTGSLPKLSDKALEMLKPGGRLFAVIGHAPAMQATLFKKDAATRGITKKVLFETVVKPLKHVNNKQFIF